MYYLQSRYYDPETGRFISQDSIEYAAPEVINGINLYVYCDNNPVMGVDPDGTWSWKAFGMIVAAVCVVVAATVVTCGAAAAVLSASTAVTTAVMTGAAVGGAVAGTFEIVNQVVTNGAENINMGAVAFETFVGGVQGGISGAMGSTYSAGTRLAMRGATIAWQASTTAMRGKMKGESAGQIFAEMGQNILTSLAFQGAQVGIDARTGYLSTGKIIVRALNSTLFGGSQLIKIGLVQGAKSIWNDYQDNILNGLNNIYNAYRNAFRLVFGR